MPILDNRIAWKAGRLWLPVNTFMGFAVAAGPIMQSQSQGSSVLAKSADVAAEIVSMVCAEADEIHTVIPVPWDLDRNKPVVGRIYFVHEAAAADTGLIWKVGSLFIAKQAAVPEIQGNLDVTTTFAAHTCGATADSLEITDWNDLSWDSYITDTDILAGLVVEFDTNGDAADDECNFLGLELAYHRKACDDAFVLNQPKKLLGQTSANQI